MHLETCSLMNRPLGIILLGSSSSEWSLVENQKIKKSDKKHLRNHERRL